MALKKKKESTYPEKMNESDFASAYAAQYGTTLKEANEIAHNTLNLMCDLMSGGHSLSFVGKFSLEIIQKGERNGRNPKTKESIVIPARKAIKFKASAPLKEAISRL
jgi:DNA-binding protein HU-beta